MQQCTLKNHLKLYRHSVVNSWLRYLIYNITVSKKTSCRDRDLSNADGELKICFWKIYGDAIQEGCLFLLPCSSPLQFPLQWTYIIALLEAQNCPHMKLCRRLLCHFFISSALCKLCPYQKSPEQLRVCSHDGLKSSPS